MTLLGENSPAATDDELTIDEMLARFPGPLTLKISRLREIFLSLLLCALSAMKPLNDAFGTGLRRPSPEWIIWMGAALSSLMAFLAARALLSGGDLVLDGDGCHWDTRFDHGGMRWQDVTDFEVHSTKGLKSVWYSSGQLNAFGFPKGATMPNTRGLSTEDLAHLMTEWRERAGMVGIKPREQVRR